MTLYAFLIISVRKTLNFMHFLQTRDIPTDRPTDRRTDTSSYRDARTHLQRSYHLLMRYTTQELFFYSAKIILHRRRLGKELDNEWSKSIFSENSFGQSFFQLKCFSQKKQIKNLVEKDYWPKNSYQKKFKKIKKLAEKNLIEKNFGWKKMVKNNFGNRENFNGNKNNRFRLPAIQLPT